jgi:hypothetical protein
MQAAFLVRRHPLLPSNIPRANLTTYVWGDWEAKQSSPRHTHNCVLSVCMTVNTCCS